MRWRFGGYNALGIKHTYRMSALFPLFAYVNGEEGKEGSAMLGRGTVFSKTMISFNVQKAYECRPQDIRKLVVLWNTIDHNTK